MSLTIKSKVSAPTVVVPKLRAPRRKDYELARDEARTLYKDMNDRGDILKKRLRVSFVPFQYPVEPKRLRADKAAEGKSKTTDSSRSQRLGKAASKAAAAKHPMDLRSSGNVSKRTVGVGKIGLSRRGRV